MRKGAAEEAVAHSEGKGAPVQVLEVGAMAARMAEAAVGVSRGLREELESIVWKCVSGRGEDVVRPRRRVMVVSVNNMIANLIGL